MIRLVAIQSDGTEIDVREDVAVMYDLLAASMDWGSGFLSIEDVARITHLAAVCGWLGIEEADKQLQAYLRLAAPYCPTCKQPTKGFDHLRITPRQRVLKAVPCGHEFELQTPSSAPATLIALPEITAG